MRSANHVQLAALRNRDLELQTIQTDNLDYCLLKGK